MCENYAEPKYDFIYRGDVLENVPFVSLDAGALKVEAPDTASDTPSFMRPDFIFEDDHPKRGAEPLLCVATLERLRGVVLMRTCEANKPYSKHKVFGSVIVAPVRPFSQFGVDKVTGRPFEELVLEGFPDVNNPAARPRQAWRFMLLVPCAAHGIPDGGIICFREMQPVPIRHVLACGKIARLAIPTVGVLDQRIAMFFGQTDQDNEEDSAPEGEDSPVVRSEKRKREKDSERAAAKKL